MISIVREVTALTADGNHKLALIIIELIPELARDRLVTLAIFSFVASANSVYCCSQELGSNAEGSECSRKSIKLSSVTADTEM